MVPLPTELPQDDALTSSTPAVVPLPTTVPQDVAPTPSTPAIVPLPTTVPQDVAPTPSTPAAEMQTTTSLQQDLHVSTSAPGAEGVAVASFRAAVPGHRLRHALLAGIQ